jgi:hypothetical protein
MEVTEIALIVAMIVALAVAVRFSRVRRYGEEPSRARRNEADQQSSGRPDEDSLL